MKKFFKNNFFLLAFYFLTFLFFSQFFIKGLLPIPSDAIVGLYHPFRDMYAKEYPNGIPFKNFLITDPVRQIYPWKSLSIEKVTKLSLPLWNPYEAAGKPLLANFQASPFYPLNIFLFIQPFYFFWSFFILLQVLFAGLFMYLYLANLNLDKRAVFLGVLSFCFSGFFVSWLEWGTVVHTALWLPLILLSVDKTFYHFSTSGISNFQFQISSFKLKLKNKKLIAWSLIFTFSLISSFFAGHLQIFFYVFIFSFIYFFARWFQFGKKKKILFLYVILNTFFLILTSVQWIPTLQFISLSARSVDQSMLNSEGWFVPYQHLTQFIAPDFFGNPTTLNYWGTWNYAELVGYIGLLPLIFAVFAMFFPFDKKNLFFGSAFFLSLVFALPTSFAKIPFILNLPFISTAQPTRLILISAFSLSVLSSLGFDHFLSSKRFYKKLLLTLVFFSLIFLALWIFVLLGEKYFTSISLENILVAKRNLYLPTFVFGTYVLFIILYLFINKKIIRNFLIIFILVASSFELLRFAVKFEPFSKKEYLFPNTKVVEFLNKQEKPFRISMADSRILPPNFSTYYKIESVETYDPLYLLSFAQLIAASEREKPDISYPYGFNRIITPHNFESKITDLLNVKYLLSLSDINSEKFVKVFQEGQTRVYENKNVIPRAFLAEEVKWASNINIEFEMMFEENFDFRKTAIIELFESEDVTVNKLLGCQDCGVKILDYQENEVKVKAWNKQNGFLVITDSYYPAWKVYIDGKKDKIYKTDVNFRGVFIPSGEHEVLFKISLL